MNSSKRRHGFAKYRFCRAHWCAAAGFTVKISVVLALVALFLTRRAPGSYAFCLLSLLRISALTILPASYYYIVFHNMALAGSWQTNCPGCREEFWMLATVMNLFAAGLPARVCSGGLWQVLFSGALYLLTAVLLDSLLEHFADEQDQLEYRSALKGELSR